MPTLEQGKNGSHSHEMSSEDSEWVVASDAIRRDVVGEELIQSGSLSLGRDCIVLLVYSYLLDMNQRTSRNTGHTRGHVDS